ncbi:MULTISPECIES: cysteine hydrolase family protein [Bacillus]|uniref:cysteine hydrolase family protein n=1 Tax=Bacillus TaxID=1386 RepID=UPI00046AEEC0|nr:MULTISPECIES: cysteine hydrolase family protein [Bacillus]MED1408765.1 cysteine hydrolase family protein [Bacillus paramycoides]MED1462029.1 cysteine hydrolase family protein [Bacillus paramycoides]MED1494685.1 cysteine hydrolase family protein [Bacillus paramycoides]
MLNQVALIIIDVQEAFNLPYWGMRNTLFAEDNMRSLLEEWRRKELPVIHIQHVNKENVESMLHPDAKTVRFKEEVRPILGEIIIQKSVNSAFIGTNLEEQLREKGCKSVVIVGLTTNHCVETTTRMAGNLGFSTYLVSDATATFNRKGLDGKEYSAEDIHNMTLVNLHDEFATIVTTKEVLKTISIK